MVLGYSQAEALHALDGIQLAEDADAESIIRACLKKLAAG